MKYIIHPDHIKARDGVIHFIGFKQLIRLYGLNRSDCYNNDTLGDTSGLKLEECIHLYPREDGNYSLPEKQDEEV